MCASAAAGPSDLFDKGALPYVVAGTTDTTPLMYGDATVSRTGEVVATRTVVLGDTDMAPLPRDGPLSGAPRVMPDRDTACAVGLSVLDRATV